MDHLFEKKRHGRPDFPFIVYRGNLPEYDRAYPLHWHEEMELISVTEGSGIITVQAERHQVQSGDIILIPPQTVHSIEQLDDLPMQYFNILFHPSMLTAPGIEYETYVQPLMDTSRTYPKYLPRSAPLNRDLTPAIEALICHRKQVNSEYALMVRAHLYTLLYHIFRNSNPTTADGRHRSRNYDKLKILLEHVRRSYREDISISQAAAMCGFSESHFMKLFRELTGLSFTQYVKRQRLESAAHLLRTTDQSAGQIAEEVGFHNLSYFTRAFRTRYGITPTAYRQAQNR